MGKRRRRAQSLLDGRTPDRNSIREPLSFTGGGFFYDCFFAEIRFHFQASEMFIQVVSVRVFVIETQHFGMGYIVEQALFLRVAVHRSLVSMLPAEQFFQVVYVMHKVCRFFHGLSLFSFGRVCLHYDTHRRNLQ